jgi:hypothetical protein
MAFSEAVKASVRRKSHLQCCLCKSLGVEIHHIIPQAEGGPETEDNAAPLCPTCHEIYGANPIKRKFITEARDFWYEICATRYAPDADRVERLINLLDGATSAFTGFQEFVNRVVNPEASGTPSQSHALSGTSAGIGSGHATLTVNGEAEEEFHQESRTEIEILEAISTLFDQIWYNRHWNMVAAVEEGRMKVDPIVFMRATINASLVAAKYAGEPRALGPWTDFEWGMLNGKMSALRWVLGDEWDFLDT